MAKILGISAFYHDSAAALIDSGEIISAVQEERFTRIKHDASFPSRCINYILQENKITLDDIDYIVFYEKPLLKFERLIETYLSFSPKGFLSFIKAIPLWVKEKLFQKKLILDKLKEFKHFKSIKSKIFFCDHHFSHAASAFYPSKFEKSLILVADGVGEWSTTSISIGSNNKITLQEKINFPHSLGLIYSAFTYHCGFKVNSGEYKLMGLAPYGEPKYFEHIKKNLIDLKEDGSFRLNQKYFNYCTGLTMTNKHFDNLFGRPPRLAEKEKIEKFHMDMAASIQKLTEEVILKISKYIKKKYNIDKLCLAGGVALNCVANGKIINEKIFKDIWIQPASGDAGGALGCALSFWYHHLDNSRDIKKENKDDAMKGSLLGPSYSQNDIETRLLKIGAKFNILKDEEFIETIVNDINDGLAVGWFQGKMEFGPRALGARSIIADPRRADMQKKLNLKIKFRESFRPFAPMVLEKNLKDWFKMNCDSPYMLIVSELQDDKKINISDIGANYDVLKILDLKRSSVPAITHVDYSARVQTVSDKINKKLYNLLNKFHDLTNCPILINTSFNIRGEPIVNTPEEAFRCFMGTNLDILAIGNCYLKKEDQSKKKVVNYKDQFALD